MELRQEKGQSTRAMGCHRRCDGGVFCRLSSGVGKQLIANLKGFNIQTDYADDWASDANYIPPNKHIIGKKISKKIENKNLTLRTRIKRLARKNLFLKVRVDA